MNRESLSAADRRLQLTFSVSIFCMVTAASLILGSGQGRLTPPALTPLAALLGLGPEVIQRRLRLSVLMANVLGIAALVAASQRFTGSNFQRLTAGTDLLIFLTWIVLLMPKTGRQYWWLIALSMLQCTATAVLSTGLSYGVATFLFALLMMWTLAVFSLARARRLILPDTTRRDPSDQSRPLVQPARHRLARDGPEQRARLHLRLQRRRGRRRRSPPLQRGSPDR